jgi:O-antigen/teichoic acid export membrane protein
MPETSANSVSLTVRAFWVMFARTLAFVLGFALPLLLVRRLDQTQFGLYKQVFLIVGTAVNVLPLGFHMSAFYFLPRERERQGQIVLNILLFHMLAAGLVSLLLILRPGILAGIFNSSALVSETPLIAVVMLLWVSTSFLEYLAMANQETKLATILIVTLQLSRTALLLGATLFVGSVRALICAAIIQGGLQLIMLLAYLSRRFCAFSSGFDWALLRRQSGYAIPLGVAGLFYTLQLDVHQYFVSYHYDAAAYAVYAIGCFQLPLIHILSDSVGSVMIPQVSYLQRNNNRREIILLTARMMRKLAAVYFALYIFLLVSGREFIIVLFTERYLASWPIFAVNLTMIPLFFLSNIYDPIMRAYAEHRYFLLRLRVALLTLLLVALWYGTARFGMLGVISLVTVANLIERLVTVAKVGRILGVGRRDLPLLKDVGKIAVAAGAAGALTAVVRASMSGLRPLVVLSVCGLTFSLAYLAVMLWLKVPATEEWEALQRRIASVQQHTPWRRVTSHPA